MENVLKRNVAVVGLVNRKNEILLVRTVKYPEMWQAVGGGIEEGDASPEAAAVREVFEETGLSFEMDDLEKIMVAPFDFGEGKVHCYIVDVPSDLDITFKAEEIAESRWVSLDGAAFLPAYPATKAFLKELTNKIA
jgi:NAD+ diphosphatase